TGFAGRHLSSCLAARGHEIHALVRPGREDAAPPEAVAVAAEVTDPRSVGRALERVAPEAIAHLAGASSVGRPFGEPLATWDVHLGGPLGVLEAVRAADAGIRVLVVTSGEIYGRVPLDGLPVTADTPMDPLSPYGASKAAADLAAAQYRNAY